MACAPGEVDRMVEAAAHGVVTAENPARLPAASLIIASRNRPAMLSDAVGSVLAGKEAPAEIIIVDQSDTRLAELAREATVSYVWSRGIVGVSQARNAGSALARHEVLIFLDDDILVAPGWYAALIRALASASPRTVVTGPVWPAPAERAGTFTPSQVTREQAAVYSGRIDEHVLPGGHMALYRSAMQEVGGFDERLGVGSAYPSAEDVDLGLRLLESGYQIQYVPDAVVYHRAWRTDRDYAALRWRYGVGRGGFYAKHASLRDRYVLGRMWNDLKAHALAFPYRLGHDRRRAYGDAVLVLGILVGFARWLGTYGTH
jgi:GT2 family glycosyltransferase